MVENPGEGQGFVQMFSKILMGFCTKYRGVTPFRFFFIFINRFQNLPEGVPLPIHPPSPCASMNQMRKFSFCSQSIFVFQISHSAIIHCQQIYGIKKNSMPNFRLPSLSFVKQIPFACDWIHGIQSTDGPWFSSEKCRNDADASVAASHRSDGCLDTVLYRDRVGQ